MMSKATISGILQPYPAYKPSGFTGMGQVPSHWELHKIRNLLTGVTKRNRPDLPLLSVVREKGVILRDIANMEENHNFIPDDLAKYKVVNKGQFVVNKMKAWQGSYGVSQYSGIVSPAYFVFDVNQVLGGYFHTAIRSKAYVPFFTQASDGVRIGQWDLSQAQMQEILFWVPSNVEQEGIVRYLDYVDGRISRYISARQKLVKLLEEQKQVLIHRAVTRGLDPNVHLKSSGVEWLGDVPVHWKIIRLKGNVTNVVDQTNECRADEIYIALENVESWTGKVCFNRQDVDFDSQVKRFQVNDVLFSKLRPYLAKVTRAYQNGVCVGEFLVLRSKSSNFLPNYLEKLFRSKPVVSTIDASTFGAKMPRANWHFIGSMMFPLPPLPEQVAIAEYLEKATTNIDSAINRTRRQIELLNEYRTRLIADVVTGQLDVRQVATMSEVDSLVVEDDSDDLLNHAVSIG